MAHTRIHPHLLLLQFTGLCPCWSKISPLPFFCPQCKDFFKAGRGIYEDFCRRLPFYPSDFTDGRLDGGLVVKVNHLPYYATPGCLWQLLICLSPFASDTSVPHLCHIEGRLRLKRPSLMSRCFHMLPYAQSYCNFSLLVRRGHRCIRADLWSHWLTESYFIHFPSQTNLHMLL